MFSAPLREVSFAMPTATDRKFTFSAAQKRLLRRRLLAWYARHARDLPWRRSSDPYHVWVSEVMLQQTQVATVREYFERFVRELPTVERLADADERQVLQLWEGLGYYRRARQLHAAAKQVVARHGGQLPGDVENLLRLPGIGKYTAGAIASIAFGRRAAILEANTIRLLSRLIGYRGDVTKAAGRRVLWRVAEQILPDQDGRAKLVPDQDGRAMYDGAGGGVARFNQALMELGSLVCAPADPRCGECPLGELCAARAAGLQHAIPRTKRKPAITELHEAAVVVRKNGLVLLRQCGDGERWAGLWDFPRFALEAAGPLSAAKEIVSKVRAQTGIACTPGPLIKTMRHGVTRFRITLDCYRADFLSGRVKSSNGSPVLWVALPRLADYPLSTTGRKIARAAADRG
jgi:A/G-specific adenine glycosylase